jgi:hypothetical protein
MSADDPAADHGRDDRVICEQCGRLVPADLAIHPEGADYALHFCTPECHAQWRAGRADALEREHRRHSGTDQGR